MQEPNDPPRQDPIQIKRPGLLHQKLGVPQGDKIPAVKLATAKKSASPALRKEANFAINFGHR
jgi:hypothetical protein